MGPSLSLSLSLRRGPQHMAALALNTVANIGGRAPGAAAFFLRLAPSALHEARSLQTTSSPTSRG